MSAPVLSVEGLHVRYPRSPPGVEAVRGVSLTVGAGETLAIVGESGSGKSSLCLAVMRLLPSGSRVDGRVQILEQDVTSAPEKVMQRLRGRTLAWVTQSGREALNPHLQVADQLTEAIRAHRAITRTQAQARAAEMLRRMGWETPALVLKAYPHELSGGMAQRVQLAMALLPEPQILLADEPTTALDVTTANHIRTLLGHACAEHNLALLLVSHDLGTAAMAQRMAVMYAGILVEEGPTDRLVNAPRHPYTQALLASQPRLDSPIPELPTPTPIGDLEDAPNSGCPFAPRCIHAMARCQEAPPWFRLSSAHRVACWLEADTTDADTP